MANFDAALGVKTGSEHRTDEIQGKVEDKKHGPTASALANKLGKVIRVREINSSNKIQMHLSHGRLSIT